MQTTDHEIRSVFDRHNITSETGLCEGLGKLAGKEKGKNYRSGRVREFVNS